MTYLAILIAILSVPMALGAFLITVGIFSPFIEAIEHYLGDLISGLAAVLMFALAIANMVWTWNHFQPWALGVLGGAA